MKVAVIADIHGNLPALESALADIDRRGADKIICLGDIVGKGPSSKETIALCRQRCEIVLMGNWEYALYDAYLRQKQGQAVDGFRTLWLINDIGAENMEYLGSLPHSAELRLSGRLISLFHAHPRNFNRYFADSPLEQRLELFGRGEPGMKEPADVAVYADIHDAYLQMTEIGKCLINAGSVGNPLDMSQASYVILEGDETGGADSAFDALFVRLPYDIERAVKIAREADAPDLEGYINELRTAQYFRRS